MATRVYKYGLVPIGYLAQEARDELWRANKLWNTLVAIHRESQELRDDALRAASVEYSALLDDLDAKNAEIGEAFVVLRQVRQEQGTKDESNPALKAERATIDRLKKERNELYGPLKKARQAATKSIDSKKLNDDFNSKFLAAVRIESSGLYGHTAVEVGRNFKEARDKALKSGATLRFHRFDGTGYYQFRFRRKGFNVDGVSFAELFAQSETDGRRLIFLNKDETRKKTRVRVRATLVGGLVKSTHVYQEFDLILHRPIPDDAQIQNGKIVVTRAGDRFKYDLCLTLRLPDTPLLQPNMLKGTIGVDVGFRKKGDTIIVATSSSEDVHEKPKEFVVPEEIISSLTHVIDLQSELDETAEALGKSVTADLRSNPLPEEHGKYRLWSAVANRPAHVTLSFETAYKFALWLNHEPDNFTKEVRDKFFYWWKGNSRKFRELHNLRRKALLSRKHFYRQIASEMVAQKKLIVLEDIDLTVFAETRDKNTKLSNKARAQRFLASLSELKGAIKNAADREGVPVVEVNPAYTSKTCSACGCINKDLKAEKEWTCPSCGVVHDRDVNAAANLTNMGQRYLLDIKNRTKEVLG